MKFKYFNIFLILTIFLLLCFIYKRKNIENFRIRTYNVDLSDQTTLIIFSIFMGISGLLFIISLSYHIYYSFFSSEIYY